MKHKGVFSNLVNLDEHATAATQQAQGEEKLPNLYGVAGHQRNERHQRD